MPMMVNIVATIGGQLPTIIVLIAGIVLALTNRERLGRAATFALVGLVLFLVEIVVGSALSMSIPFLYTSLNVTTSQIGLVLGGIGFLRSLVGAVAFGCLLAAIFGRR